MTDCLIVDSNLNFAEKLFVALVGTANPSHRSIINPRTPAAVKVGEVAERIKKRVRAETIILINAEAAVGGNYRQSQEAIELAFWLRCSYKLKNVIVFYGLQSINQLLRQRPEHLILLSPGCYHLRLPVAMDQLQELSKLKPLQDTSSLKPYLKGRIDLTQTRHRFANYVGMDLMMFIAKRVWEADKEVLGATNALFKKLTEFWQSIDYALLREYFDLSRLKLDQKSLSDLKINVLKRKILLIDDLAEGWHPIIGQMLYGLNQGAVNPNIDHLRIHTKPNSTSLDLSTTSSELSAYIDKNKPHLILLDLRLSGEEGKQELDKLGGYQLLRFLKGHRSYQGLPVIVFTASGNAEATKKLIEQGAEAVWTKPGLDEGLSTEMVVERYRSLVKHVDTVLRRFDEQLPNVAQLDIEESRLNILPRLQYVRYRAALSKLKKTTHYFNEFTDIFIDTNIVIQDAETLCDIYKLAHICGPTNHRIQVAGKDFSVSVPKVIFINLVLDEIIHWSKEVLPNKEDGFWKLPLLAYDVVRGLFEDSLVRTEFTFETGSDEPVNGFTRTSRSKYADTALVYEATSITSPGRFELTREFYDRKRRKWTAKKKYATYKTPNPRVLVITNESAKKSYGIPARIRTAERSVKNRTGVIKIISLTEFTQKLGAISI